MQITEKHMTRGQARQDAFDEKERKAINSQLNIKPGQVWSLFWPDNKSESGLKIRPVFILESGGSRALVAELTGSSARLIRNEDGKLIPAPGEIQLSPKASEDIGLRKSSCLRLTQRADVPIKCLIKHLGELNDADDLDYIIEEAEYLDNNKGNLLDIYRYSKDPHGKKEPAIKKVKDGVYKESISNGSGIKSNGIYSVMNDTWIKEPIRSDIPDIDKDAFDKLFKEWEDRYNQLVRNERGCFNGGQLQENLLELATPYMLRNDGKLIECSPMHPYIMMAHEKSDVIGLLENGDKNKVSALNWFHNHTTNKQLKDVIDGILNYFEIKKSSSYKPSESEILDFITQANHMGNQEFLRLRTSSMLYGGTAKSIYARISSVDFNWYPLLFDLLTSGTGIEYITICRDSNTFGGRFDPYRINGIECNNIPVDEFLCIKGSPAVEGVSSKYDIINKAREALGRGEQLNEAYDHMHPRYLNGWYEKEIEESLEDNIKHSQHPATADDIADFIDGLYDLRKESLAKDGEYGLGNLVFKEFRNRGYIDNLRELKNELMSTKLSIESKQNG